MMTIETREYGPVEINERQVIRFPAGILGFEEYKNYALIDAHKKPYLILQSLDEVGVAFILIKPELFRPDYDPKVPEDELDEIALMESEDLITFVIVTIPFRTGNISVNLQGPVLVNKKALLGKQCISPREDYRIRHDLIEEFGRTREEV